MDNTLTHDGATALQEAIAAMHAWRKQRTGELTLSSGLKVTVKKISMLTVAALGIIPTPLVDMAQTLIDSPGKLKLDIARFAEYSGVVNIVVKAAVVLPPIADEGDAEHIGINEIPIEDRIAIFNWAQLEGAPLVPFSGEPEGNEPAARRSQRVSRPAEPAIAG